MLHPGNDVDYHNLAAAFDVIFSVISQANFLLAYEYFTADLGATILRPKSNIHSQQPFLSYSIDKNARFYRVNGPANGANELMSNARSTFQSFL